jgi:hypothetical protein
MKDGQFGKTFLPEASLGRFQFFHENHRSYPGLTG